MCRLLAAGARAPPRWQGELSPPAPRGNGSQEGHPTKDPEYKGGKY